MPDKVNHCTSIVRFNTPSYLMVWYYRAGTGIERILPEGTTWYITYRMPHLRQLPIGAFPFLKANANVHLTAHGRLVIALGIVHLTSNSSNSIAYIKHC